MFISAFLKEKTTSINSFIMWDVSIQWRDIKRDKQGIIRKNVNGGEFVKKSVVSLTYDGIVQTKGLPMKINKLWNAFSRLIVGRDNGPTGIIDFMAFRENIEASRFGILSVKGIVCFFVDKFIVEYSFDVSFGIGEPL